MEKLQVTGVAFQYPSLPVVHELQLGLYSIMGIAIILDMLDYMIGMDQYGVKQEKISMERPQMTTADPLFPSLLTAHI
jgi:hypothetical protein